MGVYTRYKNRGGEGFRALVELLETTPLAKRQRMIEVGEAEDPEYTRRAVEFMLTFQDVVNLPDLELAELMAKAPPRMTAFAIRSLGDEVKTRFLRSCQPRVMAEVKDYLSVEVGPREAGAAQLKLVETARQLERRGLVKTKRLPAEG